MAFTKKFTKKETAKEAPRASSYASKKKEEEVEEVQDDFVEEAVEETDEDAIEEGERQDGPYHSNAPQRTHYNQAPTQAPRSAPRQYSAPQPTQQAPQGDRQALRLTGLFSGKKQGLFSGRLRAEDMENLKGLIEEALASGQALSFFLWENQVTSPKTPQFSLTANISAPSQGGGQGGFKKSFNRGWGGNTNRSGGYR